MNGVALLLAVVTGVFLFRVSRQWAPAPFLLGSLYMTYGQALEIGPFHLGVLRLLIAIGVVRIYLRKERPFGGVSKLDRWVIAWAICAVFSSVFHAPFSAALISRLGLIYNGLGIYWLMRVFIRDVDDVLRVAKILIVILAPIALEMLYEQATKTNLFGSMLGAQFGVEVRNGRARAQGPFGHSILAGTVGAVCLPLALLFWQRNRKLALVGIVVTVGMVIASASSGPIMTTAICLGALGLWRLRHLMRQIRMGAFAMLVFLSFAMKDPVYYLLAKIDLTGSSTGWHRAALIESSIKHLHEWWFAGTDYTAHWMPTGILANAQHTDITNYYIGMGVAGWMPLMLIFMWGLVVAFSTVGRTLAMKWEAKKLHFLVWTLGAILFGHVITFLSVPYFDQTTVPFYLLLACISSLHAWATVAARADAQAHAGQSRPAPEGFCAQPAA